MKQFIFFILLASIALPASERSQFHTDDINFDDSSNNFLREEHFVNALNAAAKKILSGNSGLVDDRPTYMAADNNLANFAERNQKHVATISTQPTDQPNPGSRYIKTVLINRERQDLSTVLHSRKSKIP